MYFSSDNLQLIRLNVPKWHTNWKFYQFLYLSVLCGSECNYSVTISFTVFPTLEDIRWSVKLYAQQFHCVLKSIQLGWRMLFCTNHIARSSSWSICQLVVRYWSVPWGQISAILIKQLRISIKFKEDFFEPDSTFCIFGHLAHICRRFRAIFRTCPFYCQFL